LKIKSEISGELSMMLNHCHAAFAVLFGNQLETPVPSTNEVHQQLPFGKKLMMWSSA
jgi:hypothetical protein